MNGLRQLGAMLALLGSLAGPAAGQAAAAHLDRDFGSGGIRFLSSSLRETTGVALVGDGRVVVGGEEEIVALLPSGRLDPGFGNGGRARSVQWPAGAAEIYGFAVDSAGRPVTVGGFSTYSQAQSRWVKQEPLVQRFTSAGRLDRGFGGGDGYVLSELGLPPAPREGGDPRAYVDDVAFDSSGRIVLTGFSMNGVTAGSPGDAEGLFLARLEESGRVDRSFARSGLYWLPGPGAADTPWAVGPGGRVVYGALGDNARSILRLAENGTPDERFGKSGYASYPRGTSYGPLLVDPKERTIASGYLRGIEHKRPNGILIRRLGPDGSLDRSFGRGGAVSLRIPRFWVADMALDERGRLLVAVSLKARGAVGEPKELALVRLRTDGSLDKTFGREGMIRIPFPGKPYPSVYLEGMDVRGGKAAISATHCGSQEECRPVVALVDLGGRAAGSGSAGGGT